MPDFTFTERADFQKMVDAQIEETLTLEYKASGALNVTARRCRSFARTYLQWPTQQVGRSSTA
jgi:hypothetical protein